MRAVINSELRVTEPKGFIERADRLTPSMIAYRDRLIAFRDRHISSTVDRTFRNAAERYATLLCDEALQWCRSGTIVAIVSQRDQEG
jgi:hypothetical protein